jgi:ABC-2 type transport system permease protein/oleandomycin transport system permease protein
VTTGVAAIRADEARAVRPRGGSSLGWAVADALTVTKRNLIGLVRIPEQLFFAAVQPVMFVLLFRYVFGGAIQIHGPLATYVKHHYVNYLMPGIFVQTVAFGPVSTAIGLAEDLQKGLIERFRALPMARSAVLAGRTMADFVRNVFVFALMTGVGYAVGFRVQTNALAFLCGAALILLFAFGMSWGFAVIGLSAPNSETAQVMSFPVLFPFIFASPAFVPVQDLPGWLSAFATHQPFGPLINAARALMVGGPTANYVEQTLAWSVGLLVVLVPLAVWRYRKVG